MTEEKDYEELKGKYKINWANSPNNSEKNIFKYFILKVEK